MHDLFPHEPSKEAGLLHPLALAYMGDAIYEVFIRQYLLSQTNHKPHHMQREAVKYVSGKAQARALDRLQPLLTEEEADVVRRGRNAKSGTVPKNTDVLTYRHSTAYECLLGYLYFKGRHERLTEIMEMSLQGQGEKGT